MTQPPHRIIAGALTGDPLTAGVYLARGRLHDHLDMPFGDECHLTNLIHWLLAVTDAPAAWGFLGPGARVLAVAILDTYVPLGSDGFASRSFYGGRVSRTAYDLSEDYAAEWVQHVPMEGGLLDATVTRLWIAGRMPRRDGPPLDQRGPVDLAGPAEGGGA